MSYHHPIMQLPNHLQKFSSATLLIASDTVMAKFFLLGGEAMEELDGIAVPREPSQDNEGGLASEVRDEPRLHDFIHQLVERTDHLVQSHAIARIFLVMPAAVERPFTGHLSEETSSKILKTLNKDLMNEAPLTIVERVLEA